MKNLVIATIILATLGICWAQVAQQINSTEKQEPQTGTVLFSNGLQAVVSNVKLKYDYRSKESEPLADAVPERNTIYLYTSTPVKVVVIPPMLDEGDK